MIRRFIHTLIAALASWLAPSSEPDAKSPPRAQQHLLPRASSLNLRDRINHDPGTGFDHKHRTHMAVFPSVAPAQQGPPVLSLAEPATTPDTEPASGSGVIWRKGWPADLSRDDTNVDFRPVVVRGRSGKSHGLYHQAFISSSTYRRSVSSIVQVLTTGQWSIELPERTKKGMSKTALKRAEKQIARLEANLFEQLEGGWNQTIREALYMLVGGFSLFHEVWHPDGRLRSLDFKYPSMVQGWINDEMERELLGIVIGEGTNQTTLPASNVLLLSYERFGSNWEGISPLRSVYRWIEALQMFTDLELIAAERFGNPWITASRNTPEYGGFGESAYDQLVDILANATALDDPVFALPDGVTLEIHSPSGKVPDFDTAKQCCLQRISEILKSEGSLIGLGSTGAYAARESAQSEAIRYAPYFAELICEAFNGAEGMCHQGTIRKMVDMDGGPVAGVYYQLKYTIGEMEDPEAYTRIESMSNQGLVVQTPEVIREVHRICRLAEPTDEEIAAHLSKASPEDATNESIDEPEVPDEQN